MFAHPAYILNFSVPLAVVRFLELLYFCGIVSQFGCPDFPNDLVAKPIESCLVCVEGSVMLFDESLYSGCNPWQIQWVNCRRFFWEEVMVSLGDGG